ncbi:MAG: Dna2/Cas4 domain-containing protein [Methanosarcinales archaeon]|jgi:CRISPR-associated exonuclease Cas4|nr:Dna2/Cas4 domain-containing protein [Methanosarcinales archaeon]
MDDESVFVSEIRMWAACPKQLYFRISAEKKGRPDILFGEAGAGVFENRIMREICLELPALVSEMTEEKPDIIFTGNPEFENRLKRLYQEIEKEIKSDENGEVFDENVIEKRIEKRIETLGKNIDATLQRSGTALFDCAANPIDIEKIEKDSKTNLIGMPPKVLIWNEKRLPYMIKTSKAPLNGVWESDRIPAAAYMIILENKYGRQFVSDSAVMDYFGDCRLFKIRPQDRRKVFRSIRKIKNIKKGKMPREKNIRLCEKCVYRGKCDVRAESLFSKIFWPKREFK